MEEERPKKWRVLRRVSNSRPLGFTAHTPLYNPWGCLYLWTLFYNLGPWAGQETLGKFPSVKKEKLKLGRWTSSQEGGCILILRLIWDTGIMSKIQPNPTHCPWDTCHLLCLVSKLFPLFRELPILWLRAHYHTQEAENVCGWLPHHVTQAPLAKHPSPGIWSEGVQRQWPWECGLPRLAHCKVWGHDPGQAALNLVLSICCEFLQGPRCFKLIPFLPKSSKFNLCCLQSKIEADPALCGLLAQGHFQLK